MPVYTFFLQNDPASVPRFELEWFDTDADASAHARELLDQKPYCAMVEVTDGEVEVERLSR